MPIFDFRVNGIYHNLQVIVVERKSVMHVLMDFDSSHSRCAFYMGKRMSRMMQFKRKMLLI